MKIHNSYKKDKIDHHTDNPGEIFGKRFIFYANIDNMNYEGSDNKNK